MKRRKYIRIGLSDDDMSKLIAAKKRVQDQTGIQISDSMFVLSLVRKSIEPS